MSEKKSKNTPPGLYKRGKVYWYKFKFEGQLIRESAKTASVTRAEDARRARRRDLELAVNRIVKRPKMPLFSVAAKDWLATKIRLAPKSVERFKDHIATLTKEFGGRLICDIQVADIATLQRKRLDAGREGAHGQLRNRDPAANFEVFRSLGRL